MVATELKYSIGYLSYKAQAINCFLCPLNVGSPLYSYSGHLLALFHSQSDDPVQCARKRTEEAERAGQTCIQYVLQCLTGKVDNITVS